MSEEELEKFIQFIAGDIRFNTSALEPTEETIINYLNQVKQATRIYCITDINSHAWIDSIRANHLSAEDKEFLDYIRSVI
jgi:hypothetical protein